jgi:hypothetical protein
MAEYDNTNRGAIWKNDKKETDKHPDFRGELNVNGAEFWVSAWRRAPGAPDKAPALSFALTPKEAQSVKPASNEMFPKNIQEDDLPF